MKPIIIILVLFLTFRDNAASSCVETFEKFDPNYVSESKEDLIESSTLTCFNLSSIENLPLPSTYKHMPQDYEQYLNIKNSDISYITKNAFTTFHSVMKLYLSRINIKQIELGAFNNLTKLKELYLNDNGLVYLGDGVFSTLKQLEVLDLSNNEISAIRQESFDGLKNLKKLFLQHNYVSYPANGLFRSLESIRVLNLSHNYVRNLARTHIMPASDNLTLLELDLSNNMRLDPYELDLSDSSLQYLKISSSALTKFDFSLLPQTIHQVILSNNKIETITNVDKLYASRLLLDDNLIRDLNQSFSNMSEVGLSHNKIEVLKGSLFSSSETLVVIDLSHNSISTVGHDVFSDSTALKTLNLSYNKISEIAAGTFRNLFHLRNLDLSHNNIEEFQFGIFETLRSLQILNVSSNQLTNLNPKILCPMSNLDYMQNLNFDNNQITSLDVEALMTECTGLRMVSLNNHFWTCKYFTDIYDKFTSHGVIVEKGEKFKECHESTKTRQNEDISVGYGCSIFNFYRFVGTKVKCQFRINFPN